MNVKPHDRNFHCPICGGHTELPKHQGIRCWGHSSLDRPYSQCSREEYGGRDQGNGLYLHWTGGSCDCGESHGGPPQLRPDRSDKPYRPDETKRDEWARNVVQRIWSEALPAAGTPVEEYLRGRGLQMAVPESLRYHPELRHYQSEQMLPAMVAAISRPDTNKIIGIHRTYLQKDELGCRKASVDPSRMMLGKALSGSVALAPDGADVAIAEGIETALSVQQLWGIPARAALSCSRLTSTTLPELPLAESVYIGADGDAEGLNYAVAAAEKWTKEGRTVRIIMPGVGKDWNDLLMDPLRGSRETEDAIASR